MTDAALPILTWYLALIVLGVCGLLPSAVLFERLHSRGVLYARPLAIAVASVAAWFLAWLGWAPYGTPLAVVTIVALAVWSGVIAWRRPELLGVIVERRALILAGEALCLAVFLLVVLARMQAPDAAGTEKPMDLMIITAVHETDRMPPRDPWFAGARLSYYHLGHVGADLVGRLAGIAPDVTFNLVTASTGALAAVAMAGLAIDVLALGGTVRRGAALVGAGVAIGTLLLVTPLVGLVNLAAANGLGDPAWWGALGVTDVPIAEGAQSGVPTAFWWWWTNTRILPGTINEFPAFTLLLGDPHAHLLALPIDFVAVALALVVFDGGVPLTWRRWLREPERLALTAIVFAAIAMTNTWDVVVYGGLWGAAAVLAYRRTGWSWLPAVVGAGRWAVAPTVVAYILAYGFIESLRTPSLSLAAVTGEHSDPARWLLVWLPPLLPVLAAIALLRPRVTRAAALAMLPFAVLIPAAWLGLVLNEGATAEFLTRGSGWVVLGVLVLAITAVGAAATVADGRVDRALAAACTILGAALLVLLATELFRIADAFPGRFNTVFKFWFNAWVLVDLGAGGLAGLAWERGRLPAHALGASAVRLGIPLALVIALATSLYVPAMAVSRAREGQRAALSGVTYLQHTDPGLHATIEWVRGNLDPRRDVVLEAVSESYTAGNMLATATGVPTLLGWPNHERQWRRELPETERRAAVNAIYRAGATPATIELARRFAVTYVYLGREEQARYGADVGRFAGWQVVVSQGGSVLVRVP